MRKKVTYLNGEITMKEIRRIFGQRLDKLVLTMNGLPVAMSKNTLNCLSIFSIFLIMVEC